MQSRDVSSLTSLDSRLRHSGRKKSKRNGESAQASALQAYLTYTTADSADLSLSLQVLTLSFGSVLVRPAHGGKNMNTCKQDALSKVRVVLVVLAACLGMGVKGDDRDSFLEEKLSQQLASHTHTHTGTCPPASSAVPDGRRGGCETEPRRPVPARRPMTI